MRSPVRASILPNCGGRGEILVPTATLGSSPCDTVVDLAAKRNKIDGLCQERLGSAFQGFSLGIRVAVGGDHNDGTSGRAALAFGKSSRPVIPGMLMSERIRINDAPAASLI